MWRTHANAFKVSRIRILRYFVGLEIQVEEFFSVLKWVSENTLSVFRDSESKYGENRSSKSKKYEFLKMRKNSMIKLCLSSVCLLH